MVELIHNWVAHSDAVGKLSQYQQASTKPLLNDHTSAAATWLNLFNIF